jgi:hypothetical protein
MNARISFEMGSTRALRVANDALVVGAGVFDARARRTAAGAAALPRVFEAAGA